MSERRHLVIVRTATQAGYVDWLNSAGPSRSWDLVVCTDPRHPPVAAPAPADVVRVDVPGDRWSALAHFVRADPAALSGYERVWLPDESVRTDGAAIDRLFALMEGLGAQIAQPALDDPDAAPILRRNAAFAVRQVNRLDGRVVALDMRLLPRALDLLDGSVRPDTVIEQQWPGLVAADACVVLDCVRASAAPTRPEAAMSGAIADGALSPLCWGGIDASGTASSLFAEDGEQFVQRLCEGCADRVEPAAIEHLRRSHLQALHEFRAGAPLNVAHPAVPAAAATATGPGTGAAEPLTTVFVFTVGDPALPRCMAALSEQPLDRFRVQAIENVSPFNAAFQLAIDRCSTPFFIQIDEDMVLFKGALDLMEAAMRDAPPHVGMVCFHLYDDDLGRAIQGVKIFRRSALHGAVARDVQTSAMDLLAQMKAQGHDWVLDPTILGRHGVVYSNETIYRRYKSMYERDIKAWNSVDGVLLRKIANFASTGSALDLFAILGAWHGIVMAPRVADEEANNATRYQLPELDVLRRLLKDGTSFVYDPARSAGLRASRRVDVAPIPVAALEPYQRRVLIVCDHYWPYSGGVESIAADLAQVILESGYAPEVATAATAQRQSDRHQGVRIHSLDTSPGKERYTTNGSYQLRGMVESGRYEAVIFIGCPSSWTFLGLENLDRSRAPHTRIAIQFLINATNVDVMRADPTLEGRAVSALRLVDARSVLSTKGMTAEFFDRHGLSRQLTANATYAMRGDGARFKARHGLPAGRPVVLHLASLYPEKNHLEFLDVMRAHPELDVTLLLVGRPVLLDHLVEYGRQVAARVGADPRCIHIPGIDRTEVGDALAAADLLVLPSVTEVSPVCLLEAMSIGLPWIASPNAGNAAELDGGVVCPVAQFPSAIALLMGRPLEREALGAAGRDHWRKHHDWEVVRRQWLEIAGLKDHRASRKADDLPGPRAVPVAVTAAEINR